MTYMVLLCTSLVFANPDSGVELTSNEGASDVIETVEADTLETASALESPVLVTMTLKNGVELSGQVEFNQLLTWTPEATEPIQFLLDNGAIQSIPSTNIQSIVQRTPEIEPLESAQPSSPDTAKNTTDIAQPTAEHTEDLASSTGFTPTASGYSFQNPAASRYLYAPSSIPLQKGQGYMSQKLLFTSGVLGVTDNVTLLIGTTVPFPFVSVVGGKYAKRINDKWHVGAGAEVFFFPFAGSLDDNGTTVPLSIGFVSGTYGDLDTHITVATGVIYDQLFSDGGIAHPVMVAGHKRLTDRLAVVTENWMLLNLDIMADGRSPYTASINSLAFRVIGNRNQTYYLFGQSIESRGYPRATWDFGLVFVNFQNAATLNDPVLDTTHYSLYSETFTFGPIPWVDYTWHFGPERRSVAEE